MAYGLSLTLVKIQPENSRFRKWIVKHLDTLVTRKMRRASR